MSADVRAVCAREGMRKGAGMGRVGRRGRGAQSKSATPPCLILPPYLSYYSTDFFQSFFYRSSEREDTVLLTGSTIRSTIRSTIPGGVS